MNPGNGIETKKYAVPVETPTPTFHINESRQRDWNQPCIASNLQG